MTEYFYPEQMGRIILLAMEEVIGREGVRSVLNLSSLASYADEYPAGTLRKNFSIQSGDPTSRIAGAGLRSAGRTRDSFTHWTRLLPIWSA